MTRRRTILLCFAGAVALLLLAAYCFLGAVMNGSFAVAGAVDPEPFRRGASRFFWAAVASACLAVASLVLGIVRLRRRT
jgi:hypothetical protein